MHLVPADRAGHPTIDDHRVCEAIEAIGEPGHVEGWATRFSLLGDPHRLAVLLCVRHAGPISVTDLALAAGMSPTAVSQCLRLLRTAGVVSRERDGKVVRYWLTDDTVSDLLDSVSPPHADYLV